MSWAKIGFAFWIEAKRLAAFDSSSEFCDSLLFYYITGFGFMQ
jgi:hypothetical protein